MDALTALTRLTSQAGAPISDTIEMLRMIFQGSMVFLLVGGLVVGVTKHVLRDTPYGLVAGLLGKLMIFGGLWFFYDLGQRVISSRLSSVLNFLMPF